MRDNRKCRTGVNLGIRRWAPAWFRQSWTWNEELIKFPRPLLPFLHQKRRAPIIQRSRDPSKRSTRHLHCVPSSSGIQPAEWFAGRPTVQSPVSSSAVTAITARRASTLRHRSEEPEFLALIQSSAFSDRMIFPDFGFQISSLRGSPVHCRPGIRIAAIAILLLQLSAHQHAGAQGPSTAAVSGVVKNRLTGQPIARALVDGQLDAMLTDSEGRFELHLPIGFTQLQVRRPGYSGGEAQADLHRLTVQGDLSGLVLYLSPTATITGHVSTQDGADTTGMTFTAYRRGTRNGHTQWFQAGFGNTNADGVFHMYDMESPGDYVLCSYVFPDRTAGPRQGKSQRGIPSQCYPADPGDGPDNLLRIAPAQQAEVEITRAMQPFYPVKISVANQPAGPGGGLQVYSQNGIPTGAMMQWKDQGAEVALPNGTYYAELRSWGEGMSYGRVDFRVENSAPAAVTLVALPLAPVAVQFHKEFTPRADHQAPSVVVVSNDGPPAQLELTPVNNMNQGSGARPIRHAEGALTDVFVMEGVTPGRYWVQATSFMEGYVSAITSGGVDLMREPLTIGPGNTVPPIEVTLRNDTGQIDCTVNGTAPRLAPTDGLISSSWNYAGPAVYAIPAGARFSKRTLSNIVASGPVSIPNVAPGTYHVMALDKYRDVDLLDEQELARLEDKGKTVTVPAGGAVSVQLDLIKADDEEPTP